MEGKDMSGNHSLNGVDVDKVESTVDAINGEPDLANFKFRLHNKWISGGHSHSTVGNFYGAHHEISHTKRFEMDADEPEILAGEDTNSNPVEQLLSSLAACLTTSIVYHSALQGIKIEELESDVEGDIDLQGFLGMSKDARPGYKNIRINFKIKADTDDMEKLRSLSKFSPVLDNAVNGTNINVQMERMV
jgi:uncharacterized OsmC-like protein